MEKVSFEILLKLIYDDKIDVSEIMPDITEDIMNKVITEVHKYKITKCGDRWVTYVPDPHSPNKRRQIRKKNQSDLYQYLFDFYTNGQQKDTNNTLSEIFSEWVSYKKNFINKNNRYALSPSTIRRYERDWAHYLADTDLARMPVNKLSKSRLEIELSKIIEQHHMSEQCAKNVVGYVAQAVKYAYQNDYITTNLADKIDRRLIMACSEPNKPKEDTDRVLTVREIIALSNAVKQHEKRHPKYMPDYAIELAMLSGMRVGEIAVLCWSDVHDGYIHIDRAEQRFDYTGKPCEYIIGHPKSNKHRRIPVSAAIESLLRRISNLGIESDFIFAHVDGTRYRAHDISCAIDRRAAEAGICKTSIHGIRRTVSSVLNEQLPRQAVASMLGHSAAVNERHYDYDIHERQEKIIALDRMYTNTR